jgi:hypothetical protein
MRTRGILWSLGAFLLVSACAENDNHLNTMYLDHFASPNPVLAEFTVCHGFNCSERSKASLSVKQWRRIAATFRPRAKNAQAERQQIASAVALIESMVAPQAGIAAHQWTHKDMLILPNLGDMTQLDCVDEAVNTWTYMTLMERGRLFHFHQVAQLSHAGGATDPFMRNTAVLKEINGGYFAIDASLVDNGVPPVVMPLAIWMGEWPPKLAANASMVPSR